MPRPGGAKGKSGGTRGASHRDRARHQLKACPAGTQLALYSIKAKKARVALVSRWDPIPSKTYAVPDKISWSGVVPLVAPAG